MTRSSFTYEILEDKILYIKDLDSGGMSVTNDIENVLKAISQRIDKSLDELDVIYRDSEGVIDGIIIRNNEFNDFYSINETELQTAILKIKTFKHEKSNISKEQ